MSSEDDFDNPEKTKVSRYPGGSQVHPGLGYYAGFGANQCVQRGVVWYNNMIVDTGTPMGGAAYKGAPASFVNLNQLYQTHNLVLEKGNATLIPANNGMATGAGMSLLSCPNGSDTPASTGGVGSPGGTPNQLGCPMGFRTFRLGLGGMNLTAVIDTGTPAFPVSNSMMGRMMGGGMQGGMQRMMGMPMYQTFMMMATFEPNPTPMPLVCFKQSYSANFCPAYWISQAVRIIITAQYTILQSLGADGKSIYYSCRGGGQAQMGDPLNGKWQMGAPATTAPMNQNATMGVQNLVRNMMMGR